MLTANTLSLENLRAELAGVFGVSSTRLVGIGTDSD